MQSSCRVLACSGSLDGGGSERQLWQLVTHLERPRFAPEVYLQWRRGPYLEQLPSDVPVHAFDTDYPRPARLFPGRIAWLQAQHLRRIVRSRAIDVVYDRTFHMTLLTGTALSGNVPRVSVIVSPPSRDFVATERRFSSLKRWLLRRCYRSASRVLCVSHEVADDAAAFYRLDRQLFQVLPSPVDSDLILQRSAEPIPASGDILHHKQAGQCHIALIGRMTAEKNHLLAVRVAQTLSPRVHLHFIGDGPLRSEIEQSVRASGLSSQVHMHGYLTNPYSLLKRCDLAFIPSLYEGYPNVALESLVLSIPVLMSNYGPTARHIAGPGESRAALFPSNDQASAVAAIEAYLRDSQAWSVRADVGRQWVLQQHALKPWLQTMMQLLEQVARQPSDHERIVGRHNQQPSENVQQSGRHP